MESIIKELYKMQDKKYRDMQVKIIPNIDKDSIIGVRTPEHSIIGVRTPELRSFAKKLIKEDNYKEFLEELPHKYFDENQLHSFIISEIKDYDICISYINKFLPYINNWATCDQLSPKVFKKNKDSLLKEIKIWIKSKEVYTIRFGIGMLMSYFLDEDFNESYLETISKIKSEEYYIKMMIAWYYATALAKQYDSTIKYLENNKLDIWVHNKTIQKAIESYRITDSQKEYLRSLKRR